MFKHNRILAAVLLTSLQLLPVAANAAALRIVATTPDLAAVAKAVAGDLGRVVSMALHTQDPHYVDARPSLALDLAKADVLLIQGLELEAGWLPVLLKGSRNGDIQAGGQGSIDCSAFVDLLDIPTAKLERSQGDVHPGGNPHYNFDPRRMRQVALGMAERLAAIDAANAAAYRQNAKTFAAELDRRIPAWAARLSGLRGKQVVVYHKSFAYLADWLSFDASLTLEPKPGIPPSANRVAAILQTMQSKPPLAILQEAWYPSRIGEIVSQKTGVPLLLLSGASNFVGGQSYVEHIDAVVRQLEQTLQPDKAKAAP